jgi:hypothetical protein
MPRQEKEPQMPARTQDTIEYDISSFDLDSGATEIEIRATTWTGPKRDRRPVAVEALRTMTRPQAALTAVAMVAKLGADPITQNPYTETIDFSEWGLPADLTRATVAALVAALIKHLA